MKGILRIQITNSPIHQLTNSQSLSFTNVMRSTNCVSAWALAGAPLSMIEQRLLFLVGEEQPLAGAAAVGIAAILLRLLDVCAEAREQRARLVDLSGVATDDYIPSY